MNTVQILCQNGNNHLMASEYEKAAEFYEKALDINENNPIALNNLATIYITYGKLTEAKVLLEKSLKYDPKFFLSYNNLGNLYMDLADHKNARRVYYKALEIMPRYTVASSNILLSNNYSIENESFVESEIKKLSKNFEPDFKYQHDTANRELKRIGYVSCDFRIHSVSFFIRSVLKHHSDKYNIYIYSDVSIPDVITNALVKESNAIWRNIENRSHDAVAKMVVNDNIDLLIDLGGHTACNRMEVFSRQPAPLQISYIGHAHDTGLPEIKCRIADKVTDTKENPRVYRMDKCFLSYHEIENLKGIDITTILPKTKNGYVTFGSFNNFRKYNEYTLHLWGKILSSIENSRLLLKTKPLQDKHTRKIIRDFFEKNYNITGNRIELVGQIPSLEQHLNMYNKLDISLDTYPYNGTTTTCESLLMGCPVVTLAGDTHRSRVSASILTQCEFTDLICTTEKEYIDKCIELADENVVSLYNWRNVTRGKFLLHMTSGKDHTRKLEEAYKEMWGEL